MFLSQLGPRGGNGWREIYAGMQTRPCGSPTFAPCLGRVEEALEQGAVGAPGLGAKETGFGWVVRSNVHVDSSVQA